MFVHVYLIDLIILARYRIYASIRKAKDNALCQIGAVRQLKHIHAQACTCCIRDKCLRAGKDACGTGVNWCSTTTEAYLYTSQ